MKYESETCTRCGGSGHYSYNQISGTRCFKCRGTKVQLTKRGAAAKAYADAMLNKPVEEVLPGQLVQYVDVLAGKRYRYCTLVEREGYCGMSNGKPIRSFDLVNREGKVVMGLGEGILVRVMPSQEQLDEIEAYQNSLTKAGTSSRRKPQPPKKGSLDQLI